MPGPGGLQREARWPEVTTDIAVGQMRAVEFVADAPGDWAMHCHKSHHTMNAMGHSVQTLIGVDHQQLTQRIRRLVPDYMVMGERGMADMAAPAVSHAELRNSERRENAMSPPARPKSPNAIKKSSFETLFYGLLGDQR